MPSKLKQSMTVEEFDCGYWYAVDIKAFAKEIGISPISKLRKDELEELIRHFLKTGKVKRAERKTNAKSKVKDNELGLSLTLEIINYADIEETKDFIMREAQKIVPNLKKKYGAQYRLNRWREEQISAGMKITYKDLIDKFVELSQFNGSFPQAPSGRYINFLSDFMNGEKNATREEALKAWHELKEMNIPKNYKSWKNNKTVKC